MKRVTFITTGQPTTNPRLVKEAETLQALGYQVKVICCFYSRWARDYDEQLVRKFPGMYLYCGGDPQNSKLLYYATRIRQKLSFKLFGRLKQASVPENAISRTHYEALALAKKIKSDLYIAHNLGALPAAVLAAESNGAKVGYDAEDMHSGQSSTVEDKEYQLNKYIEEKYFPAVHYFTAASPLIALNYHRLYPFLGPVVINNVFPRVTMPFSEKREGSGRIKLFWFSQTIGAGRGIEDVIAAMARVTGPVELHLLGECAAGYEATVEQLRKRSNLNEDQVHFHGPTTPDGLFTVAMQFDIGLATELREPLNRDICLTNKIFTYIQCGLAVIASNTQAQTAFFTDHPDAGQVYKSGDIEGLAASLNAFIADKEQLFRTRLANYQLGQESLNWETEGRKFIQIIRQLN